MITVILYGHLAKLYGRKHRLAISTPAEAIRAFCANYADFKAQIIQDGQAAYRVLAGKDDRADQDGLHLPTTQVIKIVPTIYGAGGFGKILLGAALVGLSFWNPAFAQTALWGSTTIGSLAGSIGFSLLLGGVAGLLFSPPKQTSTADKPDNKPSYNFNGPVNTTAQGNAVPVLYGENLWVGGQIISASTITEDL